MVLFIVGWITGSPAISTMSSRGENEMRIYNKRNFAAGILSLALAVACGVVLAVTGFQTKWLIALVLLLAGWRLRSVVVSVPGVQAPAGG